MDIQSPHTDTAPKKDLADPVRSLPSASLGKDAPNKDEPQPSQQTLNRHSVESENASHRAPGAMILNSIEPRVGQQHRLASPANERPANHAKTDEKPPPLGPRHDASPSPGNQMESDEIFTARQSGVRPPVPHDVETQYLRVGNRYYHRKDTAAVAFEDKGNKLETRSNSGQVAGSLVRIAEARGWDEIKVSGTESFRREVWLEAAARGMQVRGYRPTEQDKIELARRAPHAATNGVEKDDTLARRRPSELPEPVRPDRTTRTNDPAIPGETAARRSERNTRMAEAFVREAPDAAVSRHPELAGTYAAVAAIEKQTALAGLNARQRAIVMERVRQNASSSIERGTLPQVKVKEASEVKIEVQEERELSR